uniref:NADH-ubiquinone oxidoreductase chain 4L n=2 Tax=Stiphodon TaxID=150329 RepID=A0A516IBJ6_9GOBI|nr:NADH dehydrogenase subunit 4L [Stiphodon tuivi]QDP13483.1 NADH dehydrogenase subunit 4L [Stiphodon tuivi]QDP13496.1 NADH dehydrogenase subunit 4L [Stiphodon tuivi]
MTPTQFTSSLTFLMALAGLTFYRTHLLSALLCLEAMMLSLYVALSAWTMHLDMSSFSASPLLLLAFSACEASAGLALLVATARTHGTDHMQSLNLLKC